MKPGVSGTGHTSSVATTRKDGRGSRLRVRQKLRFVGGFSVRGTRLGAQSSLPSRKQIISDEGIEIAIEDAVHIAHLELCSMVLDQAIRLQRVGPDLAAETDVALGFVQLAGFRLAFLNFQFVEA